MASFLSRNAGDLSIAQKLLRVNWLLVVILGLLGLVGFAMLFSVADGSTEPWARRQGVRFIIGVLVMLGIALIDIRFWRRMAYVIFIAAFVLLVSVEFIGVSGMGAQRWINLGFIRLQPSELMKIALILALARYYHDLPGEKTSRPLWLLIPLLVIAAPTLLVLKQPDLGTALLLAAGGGVVMFLAGVGMWFFLIGITAAGGGIYAVMTSRGTDWQILKDYQYRRIETFLNPEADPLGAGYHIIQSKIAFGSGGVSGKGFLQGSQSRLDFLPEKHTDFIFTALAEQLGLTGSAGLLGLYMVVVLLCLFAAFRIQHRFGKLLTGGIAMTFFLYFALNMAMVMGLAPVVGVPLPLISYGGTSMMALQFAFGLMLSAHVHRNAFER